MAWQIVEANDAGIRAMLRRPGYVGRTYQAWNAETREDHLQEARIAAHRAVLHYDPAHGKTVLSWIELNSANVARQVHGRIHSGISLGRYALAAMFEVERARQHGEEPDVDEIAARLGVSRELVLEAVRGATSTTPHGLHSAVDENGERSDAVFDLAANGVWGADPADLVCMGEDVAAAVSDALLPTISARQAAERVGVSVQAVRLAASSGRVRSRRVVTDKGTQLLGIEENIAVWEAARAQAGLDERGKPLQAKTYRLPRHGSAGRARRAVDFQPTLWDAA